LASAHHIIKSSRYICSASRTAVVAFLESYFMFAPHSKLFWERLLVQKDTWCTSK